MMKIKTLLLIPALLSVCLCNTNKKDIINSSMERKEVLEEKRADIQLSSFKRYQTFNEFKMRGEGVPVHSPFVYVRSSKDKFEVVVSDDTSHVFRYIRRDGVWYNHEDMDLWKKNNPITKSGEENPARSYDRIIFNDTILEYRCCYYGEYKYKDFYIKTAYGCDRLTLIEDIDFISPAHLISDMRKMVSLYNYNLHGLLSEKGRYNKHRTVERFKLKIIPNYYVLQSDNNGNKLLLEKNMAGAFRDSTWHRKV